ncbi:Protein NPC2 -like protein, partial [Trichinella patagoniensis]
LVILMVKNAALCRRRPEEHFPTSMTMLAATRTKFTLIVCFAFGFFYFAQPKSVEFNNCMSYIRITEQLFVALDAKFDVPRRKNSLFQRDEIVIVNIGKVTFTMTLFCNLESIFTVNDVAVDPCDAEGSTCPLIRGSKASITIRFVPDREVKQLKARVHGILMKLGKVPFLLPNSDACKNSNLTCPLVAGEEYTYQQSIHVLRSYPKMNLLIKWELIEPGDEPKNGSVPVCAIIRSTITDK